MKQDTGKVDIHGKEYLTVAYRINAFREKHPGYKIATEIVSADDAIVIMKATISDEKDFVISTGHAEESRTSSTINRTSALENCETSAVGRALAFFGLAGTEIASADEVANAIRQQNSPRQNTSHKETSQVCYITEPQGKMVFARSKAAGLDIDALMKKFGVGRLGEIKSDDLDDVLKYIADYTLGEPF